MQQEDSQKDSKVPARILPVIIFSQFAGTSLWFAGNAVAADLQAAFGLGASAVGQLTSAVQLGFIAGTLVFAFLAIADRFSPVQVFLVCALAGAAANATILLLPGGLVPLLALRFATGFFLAGIYPVGMKIAADWYQKALGKAIGFLVGALVLGTAFPHLVKSIGGALPYQQVLSAVSILAAAGGVLLFAAVPNGPHRKPGAKFAPGNLTTIFGRRGFRAAAFGYFGHMWELYAFWAFVPVFLTIWQQQQQANALNISWWSFWIIAIGSTGCVVGGLASLRRGSAPVAFWFLLASGLCCLLSPLVFAAPFGVFLLFLAVWGFAVIGDSAQFSALASQQAPPQLIGTALTIMNSIGFATTIISIQLLSNLQTTLPGHLLPMLLLPGPIFGLLALRPMLSKPTN